MKIDKIFGCKLVLFLENFDQKVLLEVVAYDVKNKL